MGKPGSPIALTRTEDGYIQFMFQRKYYLKKKREEEKKEHPEPLPPLLQFPTLVAALMYHPGKGGGQGALDSGLTLLAEGGGCGVKAFKNIFQGPCVLVALAGWAVASKRAS